MVDDNYSSNLRVEATLQGKFGWGVSHRSAVVLQSPVLFHSNSTYSYYYHVRTNKNGTIANQTRPNVQINPICPHSSLFVPYSIIKSVLHRRLRLSLLIFHFRIWPYCPLLIFHFRPYLVRKESCDVPRVLYIFSSNPSSILLPSSPDPPIATHL